jgi:1-acyl-sn-glycerol-3-phosphate acyltransferase
LICHAYFYTSALAASVIIGCLHLLLAPFDPHGKTAHTLTRLLSWHYIALNRGWQVEYQGLEHLDSATTFVIVANHQSLLDVLVLARLNAFYKWIAKKQISHLIGVAQLVRINQYIPVTHGEIASVRRMMRLSKKWLRRGVSVIIFPEGERTVSGALLEFKDGPFRLACSTSTPVLPVVICGTYDILPRGAWMINFGRKVSIKVLPPVHPESFDNDAHTLNCAVREMIAVELTRLTTTPGDASSVESPTCLTSSSIEPA